MGNSRVVLLFDYIVCDVMVSPQSQCRCGDNDSLCTVGGEYHLSAPSGQDI